MQKHVLETVTFKLKEGVALDSFLKAAQPTVDYVKGCKGFLQRRLAGKPGEQWVEAIEWASMADAQAAAAGFSQIENIESFMSMIDETSLNMQHSEVQLSMS